MEQNLAGPGAVAFVFMDHRDAAEQIAAGEAVIDKRLPDA
jgi:hypothetical protein